MELSLVSFKAETVVSETVKLKSSFVYYGGTVIFPLLLVMSDVFFLFEQKGHPCRYITA